MTLPNHSRAPLVRLRGRPRRFGRATVLRAVSLDIRGSEVLVLAGENGVAPSLQFEIRAAFASGTFRALVFNLRNCLSGFTPFSHHPNVP